MEEEWSHPEPADWLHVCIPVRRREWAVLIRQVTTWRLERLGLKSLTAFHFDHRLWVGQVGGDG